MLEVFTNVSTGVILVVVELLVRHLEVLDVLLRYGLVKFLTSSRLDAGKFIYYRLIRGITREETTGHPPALFVVLLTKTVERRGVVIGGNTDTEE